MKKLFLSLSFITALCSFVLADNANSSPYKIDENSIDAQFEQAEDVTSDAGQLFITNEQTGTATHPKIESKQQTAAIVAIVMVVVGVGVLVPVHRFILGTGDAGAKIFFAYFCTASGCGVGLVLDAIFLLMNMDDHNYEDSEKIIMWNE